jgi:cytoskeletal protein RodZ
MEKELGTTNEMVTADAGGGFSSYKEAVYNFLENFFSWLSTHQGLALIIILGVLGIMIWLILRFRRYGKQNEKKVSSKNIEIGKKDALIEEQKNKLESLQKKMSDQQGVISEALLKTIRTLTGYDIDQLQTFFKSLTEISGNPLQIADTQANTMPKSQRLGEESNDSTVENDANEKIAPDTGPEEVVDANKSE